MKRRDLRVVGQAVDHPASREGVTLYAFCSSRPLRPDVGRVPAALVAYLQGVYGPVGDPLRAEAYDGPVPPWSGPGAGRRPGVVWVGFSCGKDSLAAALACRAAGHDVILYHVHGINRAYPDEVAWAREAAAALGVPLVVDELRVRGVRVGLVDSPVRTQAVMALMVARMLTHGGTSYTLGTYTGDASHPDFVTPERNWSDNSQCVAAYGEYIEARCPGFRRQAFLSGGKEAFALVAAHGMLGHVHSCMGALRFRARVRRINEEKYGPLLPGRCGSCYKCGVEILVLDAMNVRPATPAQCEHALARVRAFLARFPREREDLFLDLRRAREFRRASWPEGPPRPPRRPVEDIQAEERSVLLSPYDAALCAESAGPGAARRRRCGLWPA